jgi:hypothetical protein
MDCLRNLIPHPLFLVLAKMCKKPALQDGMLIPLFPVHGLDKIMKLPQSKLPWIVGPVSFICGVGGYLIWVWMNAIDYKYVIAGKPFYSWPAYFLPGFECAALSAAIACLFGLIFLNKMPFYHSLFKVDMFKQVTNDKFFISMQANDPKFNLGETEMFLKKIGASNIAQMEE